MIREVCSKARLAKANLKRACRPACPQSPSGITAARFGLGAALTDDVERIVGRAPIDFATFAPDSASAWPRINPLGPEPDTTDE